MVAQRPDSIRLRGARQNNLKGFDVDIPVGKLVVVTGLSGAGKSSLVFETLHAEGQRRYVETFSPYVRQFLELLPPPALDGSENIRPSVAIRQGNAVRTSRSTVGTMTELCDWFKVWFAHRAELRDPATGEVIRPAGPGAAWERCLAAHEGGTVCLVFALAKPKGLGWAALTEEFTRAGFTRAWSGRAWIRLGEDAVDEAADELLIVQDRLRVEPAGRARFEEAARSAFRLGGGRLRMLAEDGRELARFSEHLESPADGRKFRPASPGLFSFNSPIGACPACRGFGRIIGLDWTKIIPDPALTLAEGAIAPFQGNVYGESQRDLARACRSRGIPMDKAWRALTKAQRAFIEDGDPAYQPGEWGSKWYGIRGFFRWLESTTYKMHVRVFLSRYRAYETCPSCGGARFQPESLCWRWSGRTLPELYALPVAELRPLLAPLRAATARHPAEHALEAILARLGYLEAVGLGYLTLDRLSRTLSGGEVQRVNLTSCLGAALADTVFVLDEPSVGMHARDLGRMTRILRGLVEQGNTVVVVEHDESVMRAADWLIEIGPRPGADGGHLVYQGTPEGVLKARGSVTGDWLAGRLRPATRPPRAVDGKKLPWLSVTGATANNLRDFSARLPLGRLVGLCGVSGSGKSTLLHQVLANRDPETGDVAKEARDWVRADRPPAEIALVDQSPAARTPRSNTALYAGAWDAIRTWLGNSDEAKAAGFTPSHFSFNAGEGRCERCGGAGWETVEMQFLSDVSVPCPACEGRRFRDEILAFRLEGRSVADLLDMTVTEARAFLGARTPATGQLRVLEEVGLGYLRMGQPLTTLSGGEAQRLKLVRFLGALGETAEPALLLLDEPTTGLHRDDVARLVGLLHRLVDAGHSVVVVEHHRDVLAACDWLLELGPEAGPGGGRLVAQGTPDEVARAGTPTARLLAGGDEAFAVAEPRAARARPVAVQVRGAREHNLRDISLDIPHGQLTVLTGVSGSGKSSLAFDILFAEGQRRFLECVSAYARQFVEQLPKPDLDSLTGLPPTVAIEQRVTRGSSKSTVATVTEVAQYLRVLFARAGTLHSPVTGKPLVSLTEDAVVRQVARLAAGKRGRVHLAAPLIRARKGHHQPLADWAVQRGLRWLRCDGELVEAAAFRRLDRYREHDVDAVVADLLPGGLTERPGAGPAKGDKALRAAVRETLQLGKGSLALLDPRGRELAFLSTARVDAATGEAYPEIDPKHLSWNSPRGWCPECRGHGRMVERFSADEEERLNEDALADRVGEAACPACQGQRLAPLGRAVRLGGAGGARSLPELLALAPAESLDFLRGLRLGPRERAIADVILPEITARLRFLGDVGLGYLALNRPADTLSGGEAQRIRLASQLGSTLCGALYVLDEPSIGLHPRDNDRLIASLRALRDRGNTVLVVEHDEDTMRAADLVVDLGPGAGRAGGRIIAQGDAATVMRTEASLTGTSLREPMPHPFRGSRRPVGERGAGAPTGWIELDGARLRNLRGFDLRIPRGRLTVVSGVSGAGKSTLVSDLLAPAAQLALSKDKEQITGKEALKAVRAAEPAFDRLSGLDGIRSLVVVDQDPIGKTPRSTPATYIGAWDLIRERLAQLPEAAMRGLGPGFFSFNTAGGRCETCAGAGRVRLEMSFLAETYVPCEDCAGTRFGPLARAIRWNGKSAAELLALTFEEAAEFLAFDTRLRELCGLMVKTGLGYLTLGQSSPTLSGGEAQRLKLVSELARGLPTFMERARGVVRPNLYLLEEPTIGLHHSDCRKLLELLHALVDQGHTVVVIEHHPDVLAEADWLVEIGPEGGAGGGKLLHQGTPEGLLRKKGSPTAPALAQALKIRFG